MHGVVVLRDDVNVLKLVRPAVQMRDQFVRPRWQIQAERRVPTWLTVHGNLGAIGLAGNVCGCRYKRERFVRRFAALYLNVAAHFPVTVARDNGVFADGKINYGLWRYAFPQNLTVFALQ
jgi:hypothetical protein